MTNESPKEKLSSSATDAMAYAMFYADLCKQTRQVHTATHAMTLWRQDLDIRNEWRHFAEMFLRIADSAGLQVRVRKEKALAEFDNELVTTPAFRAYDPAAECAAVSAISA